MFHVKQSDKERVIKRLEGKVSGIDSSMRKAKARGNTNRVVALYRLKIDIEKQIQSLKR